MWKTIKGKRVWIKQRQKFIVRGTERDDSGDTGNNIIKATSSHEALKITRKKYPTLTNLKVRKCGKCV